MDVADSILIIIFVVLHTNLLIIPESAWAILLYHIQHLRIFAHAGWSVKNDIGQLRQLFGKFGKMRLQFGVDIELLDRLKIIFIVGFIKFHKSVLVYIYGADSVNHLHS